MKVSRYSYGNIYRYALMPMAVLCTLGYAAFAQPYTPADSVLVKKLQKAATDSVQLNPKASIALSEKELTIARAIDYKPGIAMALINTGHACFKMGNIKAAFRFEQEGLDFSREYKLLKPEATALNRMAQLYSNIGALDKTFEYFNAELKIRIAMKDSGKIANCYHNLALVLHKQDLFEDAITDNIKAVAIAHAIKDTDREVQNLCSIAEIHMHEGRYAVAHGYIIKALKIKQNATTYGILEVYYTDLDKKDSALYYANIAYKWYAADSDRLNMARITKSIGNIEAGQGKYDAAEKHLKRALEMVTGLSDMEEMSNTGEYLAALYVKRKDYKNAYDYIVAAKAAEDSFSKTEVISRLAELGTRFEVKEIEEKNRSLQSENDVQKLKIQRRNILIAGAISALVALIIIGSLFLRQNKLRSEQQKTELEQKQLRAQMNPHFIFNCLNSIQHFIVANDVRNANKYLSGFALLMRQTLENSKQGVITLRKEIAYLENYLTLERMRFEDKFSCAITCAPDVNPDRVEIPAMIIQPFIENAIRHGLCYLEGKPGELNIRFYTRGYYLYCEVDDNGIGREQSQKLKMGAEVVYESQGMELTRQRLALVSKGSDTEYKIEIKDKVDDARQSLGTTIIIAFPLEV